MNYQKHYDLLIDRSRSRPLPTGYTEKHHVVPVCMGGDDSEENLVRLTPEEHFFAHVLLLKIYKDTKYRFALSKAVCVMCSGPRWIDSPRPRKMYGWLKREFSESMQIQTGDRNSQYGTMWISNSFLMENCKIDKGEPIPEGWVKGRNVWKKEQKLQRKKEKLDAEKQMRIERYRELYAIYDKFGWESVVDAGYVMSQANFAFQCEQLLPEFVSQRGRPRNKFRDAAGVAVGLSNR